MTTKPDKSLVVRLRQDTDIYRLGKKSLLFRRGPRVLKLYGDKFRHIPDKFIKLIEKWGTSSEFKIASGLKNQRDFNALFTGLMNRGFLEVREDCVIKGKDTDSISFIDSFSRGGLYSVDTIQKTLNRFRVSIFGPSTFVESVTNSLNKYNIVTKHMEFKCFDDNRISFSIPHNNREFYELYLLYLTDINVMHIKELAYELVRRNITWLPIHSSEENCHTVGPVVTSDGPCLYCYKVRKEGNMLHPEVIKMISSTDTKQIRCGTTPLSHVDLNLLSSTIQVLVIKYILGEHSAPNSRISLFYRINSVLPQIESKFLYKNPYCEVCGPASIIPGNQAVSPRSSLT